jgi:hypothetical protein
MLSLLPRKSTVLRTFAVLLVLAGLLLAVNPAQAEGKYENKFALGVRGGALFVPEAILTGLFFDEADGTINFGGGIEFIIQAADTFEYQIGLTYHDYKFFPTTVDNSDGKVYHPFLSKGDSIFKREYIDNTLSYLALDVRFMKFFPMHPKVRWMLGGGIGAALLFGKLLRTKTNYSGTLDEDEQRENYQKWKEGGRQKTQKSLGSTPQNNSFAEDRVPIVVPVLEVLTGIDFFVHKHFDFRLLFGFGFPRVFSIDFAMHYRF